MKSLRIIAFPLDALRTATISSNSVAPYVTATFIPCRSNVLHPRYCDMLYIIIIGRNCPSGLFMKQDNKL